MTCAAQCGDFAGFVNLSEYLKKDATYSALLKSPSAIARFFKKFHVDQVSGCWIWTGATGGIGRHQYGFFVAHYRPRKATTAHRFIFQAIHGDLPQGIDVHHACENKLCVNPAHLRAMPHRQNCQLRDNRGNGYRYFGGKDEYLAQYGGQK